MNNISKKKCLPCTAGTPPLTGPGLKKSMLELDPSWKLIEEHHIEKEYTFPNFSEALKFTNRVGEIAEQEGHHPDIFLAWGKVKITLWTHKINGLSENDFILAAKCDEVYPS